MKCLFRRLKFQQTGQFVFNNKILRIHVPKYSEKSWILQIRIYWFGVLTNPEMNNLFIKPDRNIYLPIDYC